MGKIVRFIEEFLAGHKTAILLLLLLISVTGLVLGARFYREINEDPQFCAKCHMMQESFQSWETSSHRDIICQRCHHMSLLEQNRLLLTYVSTGYTKPQEQIHGIVAPWNECSGCHGAEAQQGSVSVRKSHGHARHVYMEEITCDACHSSELHNFSPDQGACKKCHEDRLVHGMGMEGLACLSCHVYGEDTPEPVSDDKCYACHAGVKLEGPMSGLHCFECHKPHGELSLDSQGCLGNCHGGESRVGQHGVHIERAGLQCLDCHKAHKWEVGLSEARGLCDRCHRLKDPRTFIY